jgi:HEAT repeat protein
MDDMSASGASRSAATSSSLSNLIEQLKSSSGVARKAAREQLVEIGAAAVPALLPLLASSTEQVRWEAAKALTEIPDASAAEALVARLTDAFSIRWLASTALINIGEPALVPLIRGLMAHPDSPRVRESAHRVLTELRRAYPANQHIPPLLAALAGQAQTETIPWVGRDILKKLGLVPPDQP